MSTYVCCQLMFNKHYQLMFNSPHYWHPQPLQIGTPTIQNQITNSPNPHHNHQSNSQLPHITNTHQKSQTHVERKSGLSFTAESKSLEKKLIVWKRKRETKKEGTNHKPMQRGSWVWAVWWKGSFRRRSLQSVKEKERDREAERKREMQRMSERPGKREWERKREKKNIATCYGKLLVVATYYSKLLKLFRLGTFNVEHILVFWVIK